MRGEDEGFRPEAAAFVALALETEGAVKLQAQHRRNRRGRSRCGSYVGQLVDFDSAVTCPRCKSRRRRTP